MENNIKGVKIGTVISDKMDKTVVVAVNRVRAHRLYKKKFTITSKFKAHDEENQYKEGDVVEISPVKPLSKDKFFKVIKKVNI